MKRLFNPFSIASLAVVVVGLVLGQPAVAVIGAALWIGSVAIQSIKRDGARHVSELSPTGRHRLSRLTALREQISAILAEHGTNPTIKVIGGEALVEADSLIGRTGTIIASMDELLKIAKDRRESEAELARLQSKLESATSLPEKDSLRLAIDVRQTEIAHYTDAERGVERAKSMLDEAETALVAIKSQLMAAAVGQGQDDLDPDDLRGMVGRLKSLSSSLEEVEQTMDLAR